MERRLLFEENRYCCENKQYVGHNDNDYFSVYEFDKDKKINEMRRDLYFESQSWCKDKEKLFEMYTESKNKMKMLNKEMHDIFYSHKKIKLYTLLEDFDIIDFYSVPKNLKQIEITNGKIIYFGGNQKCFIGENNDKYYVAYYGGS